MPDDISTADNPSLVTVLCLACGGHVRWVVDRGDHRMRYADHTEAATGERCPNSGELIDAGGKS